MTHGDFIARFVFGVRMPWERKGTGRNRWGLILHLLAGAGVGRLWFNPQAADLYSHWHAIGGVLTAIAAGVAWEVVGWKLWKWPGNALDVWPWPIGAAIFAVVYMMALGF